MVQTVMVTYVGRVRTIIRTASDQGSRINDEEKDMMKIKTKLQAGGYSWTG